MSAPRFGNAMAELIVALDLPTARDALGLVDRLGGAVSYYKVGAPLFTEAGPSVVRELREREKRVFLDLKFHDIPNTVARAVENAAALEVDMLTLHASGGAAMLVAAREARDAIGPDGPRLVGVTLLTSLGVADVEQVWGRELTSLREEVFRLAALAAETELDGVVSSPLEAEALKRRHGDDFIVITPGIRPADSESADQVRVGTPAQAVRAGSDFLVVGRPILRAADPAAMVEHILEDARAGTED